MLFEKYFLRNIFLLHYRLILSRFYTLTAPSDGGGTVLFFVTSTNHSKIMSHKCPISKHIQKHLMVFGSLNNMNADQIARSDGHLSVQRGRAGRYIAT